MKRTAKLAPGNELQCDDWVFVVSDGDIALALTIFSGRYPDGSRANREPSASYLTLHVGWPVSRQQVANPDEDSAECCYVDGGRCYGATRYTGCLIAGEFARDHFEPAKALAQDEGFWIALENRCREWAVQAHAERADTVWRRCECCDGAGTVAR